MRAVGSPITALKASELPPSTYLDQHVVADFLDLCATESTADHWSQKDKVKRLLTVTELIEQSRNLAEWRDNSCLDPETHDDACCELDNKLADLSKVSLPQSKTMLWFRDETLSLINQTSGLYVEEKSKIEKRIS